MRILICEDEEILLTALELRLRKQGFEVHIVNNDASIATSIGNSKPNLIVLSLDTNHSSINDWLSEAQNGQIPIIIIGEADEGELLLGLLKKGVSDFMIKPFKPAELVLRIRKVLDAQ